MAIRMRKEAPVPQVGRASETMIAAIAKSEASLRFLIEDVVILKLLAGTAQLHLSRL
jgi:hypothetical protein